MRFIDFAPILALLATSRVSFAQRTYTFVSFDYPGAYETSCNGINSRGEIVGNSYASVQSGPQAFLRSANGKFSILLGGKAAEANGINDSGAIVGSTLGAQTVRVGYVLSRAGPTPVFAPNYQTQLTGISSNGTIVGAFDIPDSEVRYGFEIVGGTIQQLPLLDGEGVLPLGVNSAGTVVVFGPGEAGFILYVGGSYQQIQFPGDVAASTLTGINDSGVAAGGRNTPSGAGGQGLTYFQGALMMLCTQEALKQHLPESATAGSLPGLGRMRLNRDTASPPRCEIRSSDLYDRGS